MAVVSLMHLWKQEYKIVFFCNVNKKNNLELAFLSFFKIFVHFEEYLMLLLYYFCHKILQVRLKIPSLCYEFILCFVK